MLKLRIRRTIRTLRIKKYNLKTFVIGKLRQATLQWPGRTAALGRARVKRGNYKCERCNVQGFKRDDVELDHIKPVIGAKGFTSWDEVIPRMFPGPEGLQVLCIACHKAKTNDETTRRAGAKRRRKKSASK